VAEGGGVRRWLGRLALLACAGLFAFVHLGDPFGDRGMSNVFGALIVLLVLLGVAVAFARRRSLSLRLRACVLGGLASLLALAAVLLRLDGVSAEMVPRFAWRFGTEPAARAPSPASAPVPDGPTLGAPGDGDFPGFLGPRRDNAVAGTRLARDWTARPPRRLWRAPIGAGWSAFALAGGWAFTLEQDAGGQRASARDLATGELRWSVPLDEPFAHVLGGDGPRATPTVELDDLDAGASRGGRVYAHTAWGKLACLEARTGAKRWEHDLRAEAGLSREAEIELSQYGRASSPLLVGELVVVSGGGEAGAVTGLVAFDKRSGERRWASPARNFSYSSPSSATLAGVPQILCVNEASLTGHAPEDGRILWEVPWPGRTSGDANCSQAVPLSPARVLVSKGYGGGAMVLELTASEGSLVPREVWHDGRLLRTKLTNVVVHEGHAYGLDDGTLECVELATGAKRWKEGRYGHGQVLLVGELVLLCSEEGEVFLIEPSPEAPDRRLGSFQALAGKSWAHLALRGNLLVLRNAEECAAWELPLAE
jgi:outer membrane protein assembly factor BamB